MIILEYRALHMQRVENCFIFRSFFLFILYHFPQIIIIQTQLALAMTMAKSYFMILIAILAAYYRVLHLFFPHDFNSFNLPLFFCVSV